MDLVRQLRRAKGWSQEHLAVVSRLSRATIQRVEGGKVVPDKETALALAGAFGVDAAQIRLAAGLAARVHRVAAIMNERAPTAEELRSLTPEVGRVFAEFAAARSECEAATRAMKEAGERSSAAHRARMEALSRCTRLIAAVSESPGDAELRRAYSEALARVADLPVDGADEAIALGDRSQRALGDLTDKGLALSRLLFQFV